MNKIAAQLRSLKDQANAGGFSVDAQRVAKRALLSSIGADLAQAESAAPTLRTTYLFWLSRSFISRPIAIGVAAVTLATSGLMTTVSAAQDSVPGDALYSVKLVNERAQLQLASLDRRAVLHTEFAERRLREVAKLQSDSTTRNSSLVTDTMNAYTQEVASANQNLRELQASGDTTTIATANEVDQKLASLDSTITNSATPVTSAEGSAAVSAAQVTTQVAQEDTVTVAVEAQQHDETGTSSTDLQTMFIRQFGAITTRKAFDLHRVTMIRTLLQQKPELVALGMSDTDLSRLERSINIAVADIAPAMDQFSTGGYRSAFDVLQHADTVLRGIEATIADMETSITAAMMEVVPDPAAITPAESSEALDARGETPDTSD